MKTLQTIATEKIKEIRDLYAQYYDIKDKMGRLNTSEQEQAQEWNKLYYEQLNPTKKSFKNSVFEFATLLGFSLKEDNFKPSFANYERIFTRLLVRWANSQVTLHSAIHMDREFFDNNEYPYRSEDLTL